MELDGDDMGPGLRCIEKRWANDCLIHQELCFRTNITVLEYSRTRELAESTSGDIGFHPEANSSTLRHYLTYVTA